LAEGCQCLHLALVDQDPILLFAHFPHVFELKVHRLVISGRVLLSQLLFDLLFLEELLDEDSVMLGRTRGACDGARVRAVLATSSQLSQRLVDLL